MPFCSNCGAVAPSGVSWCSACGRQLPTELEQRYPPPPGGPVLERQGGDSWFGHLLRFMGVGFLVAVSMYVLVGFVWLAHIYSRTGHRKRDLLFMFVPIWGGVVQTRALWRYTAREVYWESQDGRPNDLLRGWQRPWAIGVGWVLLPLLVVGGIAVAASIEPWPEEERLELIEQYERQGFDRVTATCIADQVIDELPAGPDMYEIDEFVDAETDAIGICG